ncbi:MAG: 3'-5' exonuclease [Clostridia bacterium]|nr:3'-5' exonuclease [Clostridia bacterium]
MKLLFFDIECAGVHKTYAKICVFGYVLCDEKFNILEKEDILINPRGKFELTDRKGEKGIVLPYEYAEFKKQPAFPKVYSRIKELIEDEDTRVLGHAVLNDVKYLNLECKRFRLPALKYSFADSQLLFMSFKNDFSHQYGLEHIAEELGVEFTPHRAVDDAYATMRITEAMCRAHNCGYDELIRLLNFSNGKTENYFVTRPQSGGFKKYKSDKRAVKEARSRARVKFYNNLTRKRYKKGGRLDGKTFNFSRAVEDNIETSVALVDKIYAQGGKYTQHVEECTVYVCPENDATDRTKKALKANKSVISLEELTELLND